MTKDVAEDKLKKIWETWKMPTSNPFYFDVKSLIDEIIDDKDNERHGDREVGFFINWENVRRKRTRGVEK